MQSTAPHISHIVEAGQPLPTCIAEGLNFCGRLSQRSTRGMHGGMCDSALSGQR